MITMIASASLNNLIVAKEALECADEAIRVDRIDK